MRKPIFIPIEEPAPIQTEIKTETPSETPSETPAAIPGLSSCVILDEEYCKKGEPLYDKNNKFIGLGFDLPDKAEIYAPFDGAMDNGGTYEVFPNQTHQGIFIEKREEDRTITFTVLGAVKASIKSKHPAFPEHPEKLIAEPVEKGEFIAQIDENLSYRIALPSGEKSYTVFVGVWKFDNLKGEGGIDEDLFKKLFGNVNIKKQIQK